MHRVTISQFPMKCDCDPVPETHQSCLLDGIPKEVDEEGGDGDKQHTTHGGNPDEGSVIILQLISRAPIQIVVPNETDAHDANGLWKETKSCIRCLRL